MKGVITSQGGISLFDLFAPVLTDLVPDVELSDLHDLSDPASVDFVLTFRPAPEAFSGMTGLKVIFAAGAGTDAILACPSLPPKVPLIRAEDPDQALQMAGFAAFHVIWHHRNMFTYMAQQQHAEWSRRITHLSPTFRRVGVLGFGHMGRAIGRALSGLGYPVSGYSRTPPAPPEPGVRHFHGDGLQAFLAQADILINVLPLTPATQGLIDAGFLRGLPQGAALIQIGRGGQVVEPDLLKVIDEGHLSGASMDVFEAEPLPADNPLWRHPRVLITPHIASLPEPKFLARTMVEHLHRLGAS